MQVLRKYQKVVKITYKSYGDSLAFFSLAKFKSLFTAS